MRSSYVEKELSILVSSIRSPLEAYLHLALRLFAVHLMNIMLNII